MNYYRNISIVLLSILMFIFGLLIAPNFLIELHIDEPLLHVVNTFFPLIGAIATTIAALCALSALYIWKKEHVWKRSEVYKHNFLLSISEYANAVFFNAQMSLNLSIEKLEGDKESYVELIKESLTKTEEKVNVQLDNLYKESAKIYFISNNDSINTDILNLRATAESMQQQLTRLIVMELDPENLNEEDIIELKNNGQNLILSFFSDSKDIRKKLDTEIII